MESPSKQVLDEWVELSEDVALIAILGITLFTAWKIIRARILGRSISPQEARYLMNEIRQLRLRCQSTHCLSFFERKIERIKDRTEKR